MSIDDAISRIVRRCREDGLVQREDRVLAAVSGGADSVFLLHVVLRLGASVQAAHLHHGLRGESADEDAAFVDALARSLGVPITIGRASVPERHAREGGSLEAVARRARYEFLEEAAVGAGANRVALGHTADDQAETVLFRILRGTGVRGLRGMPRSRPIRPGSPIRIVRPLLHVRRARIERALRRSGIAWREDPSNVELRFARNAIRHRVLPEMARIHADPAARILSLARDAASVQKLIDAQAGRRAASARIREVGRRSLSIDVAALASAAPPIREALLRLLLRRLHGEPFPLRRAALARLDALLDPAIRTGARAPLGRGAVAVREGAAVRLCAEEEGPRVAPDSTARIPDVAVAVPGDSQSPLGLLRCTIEPRGIVPRIESPFQAVLDAERAGVSGLCLGPPRIGDHLRPLGSPGSKLLRRLLTDWKVAPGDRATVPVLRREDGSPIWVIGHRIADDVRVTSETTRILRLTFTPGSSLER